MDNQPLDSKDLFPDNFTRREIHELDRKNGQVNKDYFSKLFLTLSCREFERYVAEILWVVFLYLFKSLTVCHTA